MQRLALKNYRVYRPGPLSASQHSFIARMDAAVRLPKKQDWAGRIPASSHSLTVNRAVRDQVARVMRDYLEHPCAVPDCPCMTHRLGLPPLADLVAAGYFATRNR